MDQTNIPAYLCDKNKFNQLWHTHPEEHGTVMIFGKLTPIPRWQRSYGKDYYFSGTVSKGFPVSDELKPYLDWVNGLGYGNFNEILVNWYSDGSNYKINIIKNDIILTILY